ncbi:uncharacterized protein N7477_000878 [Penicillium maclennaniae]|uniref:uncharacterized protein n=1 Tax=Penicillium maclennaniae TaxID=1343394 RepID=UPI00253FA15D|nr:uncharacterized protein N7477_000878 [Penicillium maclennaniae]KAJ5684533.1 hypothetical protein N7477_000878 [Penicillium maclennaniae]
MAKLPGLSNVYLVSELTTLGGLIEGFDVSSMSAIIGTDQYKNYFNGPDAVLQGGITASMAGGSLFGSLFSSWTSDRFGRRDSLFIACIIWLIGSTLMCAVQNVAMLIVSRILNGFAVGMLTSQGPILIAEISLPHQRGRLLSLQQWMITWGMEEAIEVLARLHAQGNRHAPIVVTQTQEISDKIGQERQYQSLSWLELFNSRNIGRVHCAVFTHIWAQMTGTNAMMYYIVYIFQMAGLTGNSTLISASIRYVINVVMTLPALIFIDRLPRRELFILGALGMGVFQFIQAGLMATYGNPVPGGLEGSPTVTWKVTNPQASKGLPPEIIPLYIRSKAVSLATSFNWSCNFALTFFTPPGFRDIQWRMYCVFGTLCFVAAIHVFFLFQETVGKSLEETDEIFDKQSVWAFKARQVPSRLAADIGWVQEDIRIGKVDAHVRTSEPRCVNRSQ